MRNMEWHKQNNCGVNIPSSNFFPAHTTIVQGHAPEPISNSAAKSRHARLVLRRGTTVESRVSYVSPGGNGSISIGRHVCSPFDSLSPMMSSVCIYSPHIHARSKTIFPREFRTVLCFFLTTHYALRKHVCMMRAQPDKTQLYMFVRRSDYKDSHFS
jgi:hypothetical protein